MQTDVDLDSSDAMPLHMFIQVHIFWVEGGSGYWCQFPFYLFT